MDILMSTHIAGGVLALLAGGVAIAARKGGALHTRVGAAFVASMLVLGATATMLDVLQGKPAEALGGLVACYFVITAWLAARRRDGTTGRGEIAACLAILAVGAAMAWFGLSTAASPTPVGRGPVLALAAICLLAGGLDLNAILRTRLGPAQRISRHLWRMCFGFFIATGSFFLGQQDVMPEAVRGSPALYALAFAPFAAMAFWLARVRLARRPSRRLSPTPG
ncbi:hypothetical protein ACFODL_05440 [Phenylobacterium terrae]|uniref:DUF2306 domain-containing protein n=1 Tax=Phenylobacterium terrae TaxID=2665495 RepID=A0ABW4MVP5_9CAUL